MNRFVRSTLALALAFLFALPMTALCEGVTLALSEEGTLTIGGSGTVPSGICPGAWAGRRSDMRRNHTLARQP